MLIYSLLPESISWVGPAIPILLILLWAYLYGLARREQEERRRRVLAFLQRAAMVVLIAISTTMLVDSFLGL